MSNPDTPGAYRRGMPPSNQRRFVVTLSCPDRVGIVAAVHSLIAEHGGWVTEAAQHADQESGRFFLRTEILAESLDVEGDRVQALFEPLVHEFDLSLRIGDTDRPRRMVILVSKATHCLEELLYRWRSGELPCEIPLVISNHLDAAPLAEWYGIDFWHLDMPADPAAKLAAFEALSRRFVDVGGEVLVLARFMQVLPASVCDQFAGQVINIHHSFLPSFAGARPYHQAFARGVKLIGATCHYATAELDAGPIIEQDVVRVDHADRAEDLVRIGRDVERSVLAKGVRWHLEDRVLLNGTRTVVFP